MLRVLTLPWQRLARFIQGMTLAIDQSMAQVAIPMFYALLGLMRQPAKKAKFVAKLAWGDHRRKPKRSGWRRRLPPLLATALTLIFVFAFGLTLSLPGLEREITDGPGRPLRLAEFDYVLVQAGSESLAHDSFVDFGWGVDLDRLGVAAWPFTVTALPLSGGHELVVFGSTPDSPLLPMASNGSRIQEPDQVIADPSLGLDVGTDVRLGQYTMGVVGELSESVSSIGKEAMFAHIQFGYDSRLSRTPYGFVITAPDGLSADMYRAIDEDPAVHLMTKSEYIKKLEKYWYETAGKLTINVIGLQYLNTLVTVALVSALMASLAGRQINLLRAVGALRSQATMYLLFRMLLVVGAAYILAIGVGHGIASYQNSDIIGLNSSVTWQDKGVHGVITLLVTVVPTLMVARSWSGRSILEGLRDSE